MCKKAIVTEIEGVRARVMLSDGTVTAFLKISKSIDMEELTVGNVVAALFYDGAGYKEGLILEVL